MLPYTMTFMCLSPLEYLGVFFFAADKGFKLKSEVKKILN